jgi:hypothetical protein
MDQPVALGVFIVLGVILLVAGGGNIYCGASQFRTVIWSAIHLTSGLLCR